MEPYEQLFEQGSGVIHVTTVDPPTFAALLDGLATTHPGAAIRGISGERSRTQTGFFEEVGRALEIPYDSISWNVLNEALHDLTWIPADAYLLAMDDGHLLLSDAHPSALENLGAILGSPMDPQVTPGSPLAPLRLLLQSSPSAADELKRRLAAAGIWFEVS